MKSFVDEHRDTLGVEPICKVLQIAPVDVPRARGQAGRPRATLAAREGR